MSVPTTSPKQDKDDNDKRLWPRNGDVGTAILIHLSTLPSPFPLAIRFGSTNWLKVDTTDLRVFAEAKENFSTPKGMLDFRTLDALETRLEGYGPNDPPTKLALVDRLPEEATTAPKVEIMEGAWNQLVENVEDLHQALNNLTRGAVVERQDEIISTLKDMQRFSVSADAKVQLVDARIGRPSDLEDYEEATIWEALKFLITNVGSIKGESESLRNFCINYYVYYLWS